MKQTANLKWSTKEQHEHKRSVLRAAGPMKPKGQYDRHDKSWKDEY